MRLSPSEGWRCSAWPGIWVCPLPQLVGFGSSHSIPLPGLQDVFPPEKVLVLCVLSLVPSCSLVSDLHPCPGRFMDFTVQP